jgi:hypothetical protein
LFLRSWIRGASSILAIAGGALFLVLPIAFLKGTVSITYPLVHFCHVPPEEVNSCPLIPLGPPPTGMAAFWAYLGAIGIILGAIALKLSLRPRVGVALGLVLSLGSMTLLFWMLTRQILKSFITKPASFLVFPELSVVAMAGATVLFGYELSRRRQDISEAFLSYSFLWRFRLEISTVPEHWRIGLPLEGQRVQFFATSRVSMLCRRSLCARLTRLIAVKERKRYSINPTSVEISGLQ